MNEIFIKEKVWASVEKPFNFQESVNPKTGEKQNILKGIMMPFGKISRNGVLYNKESVKSKCENLVNRPVMYNHVTEGQVMPIGHFTKSYCDEDFWYYEADIDPQETIILNKLKRGDLRHVSIQLKPEKVIEKMTENNKSYIEAYVEDIIEGSLVPTPGFLDTTIKFAEALKKEDITTATADGAMAPTKIIEDEENKKEEFFNFPMEQFHKGLKIEMEHSDSVDNNIFMVAKIVIDHLEEDIEYYSKLEDIENAIKQIDEEDLKEMLK